MKVKRLVLITGDQYEQVELFKEVPSWINENVPDDFIGVKNDTFKIYINSTMIVSLEFEHSNLKLIS
ncbi:hypothetical protein MKX78_08735 [Cytobacillus sp. FSL R5-0569]|uniref:hypothetical protein n=1 Tax=Cytobacillus sp. FSL R5-0569 TaxID=2921649 RepID=UPI0030FC07B2